MSILDALATMPDEDALAQIAEVEARWAKVAEVERTLDMNDPLERFYAAIRIALEGGQ